MKWTKNLAMLAVVAASAFAGGAFVQWVSSPAMADEAVKKVPAVVEAKEFRVVDDEGNARVVLGVGEEGPGIAINDVDGTPRVAIGVGADGAGLAILDTDGKARIALGLGEEEGPGLIFLDADGNPVSQQP